METITVVASRGSAFSEMEILVASTVVILAVAFMVFSRVRHFRSRHAPRV